MALSASLITSLVFGAVLFVWLKLSARRRLLLPPGPKGLPLLGAAKEHPRTEFWKTYAEWGRKYGNIGFIYFHVLGRNMVVLNSAKVAEDLLSRRSTIYSDRPFPTMAGHLMKREKSMFYISFNDRFKTYRKLMQQAINPIASQSYWDLLQREARITVSNVNQSPEKLFDHLRRNAAATTMMIAYGYTIDKENDRFVMLAEESMRVASLAGAPGKWLVDSFPILRHLPEWFPGAGFKTQAREWAHQLYIQSLEPIDWVKQQIAAGTAKPSFTQQLLESNSGSMSTEEYEDIVLWTAGAIYAAGADTTVAGVKLFYFLMLLNPHVQRRAQAEVDAIIAKERRLPTIQDRSSMPYLEAVLKEVLRWSPASPIGLFHATSTDDEYQGYHIPAKATVIANIWAMAHDEDVYPDPFVFNPDRFLDNGDGKELQRDPRELVFGFGRRVCPGQHLAEASMFIQMATTLAVLDISKALDENGQAIEPEIAFTTAIVSHVRPFPYSIKARQGEALSLLLADIAAQT